MPKDTLAFTYDDILNADRWNVVKDQIAQLPPEEISQLGAQLIEHIKTNNLKIFKHHFGVDPNGNPYTWDNVPPAEGDTISMPFDNEHGGGIQEFIMRCMDDEQFLSFYFTLSKGMKIHNIKNITGWARFFISLNNYCGFPMEQTGGKENRIGMRFVRIQLAMIPDEQKI